MKGGDGSMMQHNEAYDLRVFENRSEQRVSRMEVRKGNNNQKLKARLARMRSVAVVCLLLALMTGFLHSQATLTELTTEMQRTQRKMTTALSEYDYLASVMDSKTSVKNVEEIARSQLGLVKLDRSQITYATLEEESVITLPRSGLRYKLDQLQNDLLSIMDYLNP